MFENKTTDELVRIIAAGGGMTMDVSRRSTDDIVRLAAAAKNNHRPRLRFVGLTTRSADELVRIAAAGGGCVEFG